MKKLLILVFLGCISCQYFTENDPRKIIVEYKGQKLYEEDLNKILPKTYTKEDSINIVEPFIKNWLQKKVTVSNASSQISEEEAKELDQQVIEYRDDLILNKYYNQQLDKLNESAITEQEIIKYYHDNERSFTLNDNLIKTQFIIAPESYKEVVISNIDDSEALKNICSKNSEFECYSSDEWMNYQQALNLLGLNQDDYPFENVEKKPLLQIDKNQRFYLIKWTDFKSQGDTGPYEYYKNTIKSILINKRKLNLQKHIEDSLYHDAIQNNKIRFYE